MNSDTPITATDLIAFVNAYHNYEVTQRALCHLQESELADNDTLMKRATDAAAKARKDLENVCDIDLFAEAKDLGSTIVQEIAKIIGTNSTTNTATKEEQDNDTVQDQESQPPVQGGNHGCDPAPPSPNCASSTAPVPNVVPIVNRYNNPWFDAKESPTKKDGITVTLQPSVRKLLNNIAQGKNVPLTQLARDAILEKLERECGKAEEEIVDVAKKRAQDYHTILLPDNDRDTLEIVHDLSKSYAHEMAIAFTSAIVRLEKMGFESRPLKDLALCFDIPEHEFEMAYQNLGSCDGEIEHFCSVIRGRVFSVSTHPVQSSGKKQTYAAEIVVEHPSTRKLYKITDFFHKFPHSLPEKGDRISAVVRISNGSERLMLCLVHWTIENE